MDKFRCCHSCTHQDGRACDDCETADQYELDEKLADHLSGRTDEGYCHA
jgi:hypothetical protein